MGICSSCKCIYVYMYMYMSDHIYDKQITERMKIGNIHIYNSKQAL